jgi:CspA family cold shock protein
MFFLKNGIVRDFDADNGYGWIVPNDGVENLYVHRSNIVGDMTTLPIDARVKYESRMNNRGLEALNVSLSK